MIWIMIWALLAGWFVWESQEAMQELSEWQAALLTVLLILFAPVFFLNDIGEILYALITGEGEEEE